MAGTTPRRNARAQTRVAPEKKTAKPAVKKTAKPVAKTARPAAKKVAAKKVTTKPAAKTAKPAAKVAKKPVPTKATKTATKPVTKATAKKAAVAAAAVPAPVEEITAAAPGSTAASRKMRQRVLVGAGLGLVLVLVGAVAAFAMRDPAPSKAEYIAEADEICRPGNGPVTAIVRPTSYPELSTVSETVVKATSAEVTQLRELRRPGGENGKQAEDAIKALSTYSGAATRLKAAAANKDAAATIAATKSLQAGFADAKAKTKSFGFSACGTGMEPGIETTVAGAAAVIKTEFTAKADSLCRAAATKFNNLPTTPDSDAGLIADLDGSLAITKQLVADLKSIPAPPGDEATVTQMLEAADKLNTKTAELRDAVAGRDYVRADAIIKEAGPISTESNHKFDAYGLGVCGSNFGA